VLTSQLFSVLWLLSVSVSAIWCVVVAPCKCVSHLVCYNSLMYSSCFTVFNFSLTFSLTSIARSIKIIIIQIFGDQQNWQQFLIAESLLTDLGGVKTYSQLCDFIFYQPFIEKKLTNICCNVNLSTTRAVILHSLHDTILLPVWFRYVDISCSSDYLTHLRQRIILPDFAPTCFVFTTESSNWYTVPCFVRQSTSLDGDTVCYY